MLLYVHVPFCRAKCQYCAFYSRVWDEDAAAAYEAAVRREIAYWGREHGRPRLETIYFGGGTPSMLPLRTLGNIVADLHKYFAPEDGAEFTLEANPDSAGRLEYLQGLAGLGVNRLSLGVQSFSDDDLARLGRPHTAAEAVSAYERARQAGFRNVSIDLIWGLPGQRLKLWLDQLKLLVQLKPEHVSAYGLTLEPGTVLERMCLGEEASSAPLPPLPSDDEQARMFVTGGEYLESNGYLHYEISSFARMGFFSRHNLGYWEGKDYLGLGPAAVSTVAGRRWENPRDLAEYARVAESGSAARGAEELDLETRARELVMLALRTARGLSLKEYEQFTGRSFVREHGQMLQALSRNDLVRIGQEHVRLTRNGMLVSNAIISNLIGA